MVITIFGLGFVGLTTALGFAEFGHTVYGVEVDEKRLAALQSGQLPFVEPGMDEALARHVGKDFYPIGYDALSEALEKSDVVYYCVGTPYGKDGAADLHYLQRAVKDTLARISREKYRVLVVKSTVPPSTAEREVIPFVEHLGWKVGKDVGIGNTGSDDVRDTPAARVMKCLLTDGYEHLAAYDPLASEVFQRSYQLPVSYMETYEEILAQSDAFVILTAWDEFRDVRKRTKKPVLDCRYLLEE